MEKRQIERFFQILSRFVPGKCKVILTGAAAGSLLGSVRLSRDIDFALEFLGNKDDWEKLEEAIHKTEQLTGVPAQYAQDISRWGMVSLLDYKKHTTLYRGFNLLEVRILEPAYWSLGKISRFLDPDIQDMISVFKKQKISQDKLVTIWGRALKSSPPSSHLFQFKRQAEEFLRVWGKSIWGQQFNFDKTVQLFYKEAGIL
ncbi:MAG: hypothetical protein A3I11_04710 [Elusimicrobia bacterium RIFCSPLOWO2_02_FULL_39_32]|nr:MAG: hypothetical protein A3B80_00895 [Elusimicrobia bacterium RIFCSPHIGHO2_02_FULL_39_36]OGR91061.1 MAG: hypothetical protein A3I11_04710 [Elusimicrobia bacterium RIFCSPLOWO2_02_FULL_39_32]OGS00028.1 MAG: hypothetical protein A3G85_07675 [Elusimicrobia bacterium RIFCSPLOWO2_12_FULL_39_28]